MRRDDLYLADIVDAADAIGRFLSNVQKDEFVGNDMLRSAVLQKLIVIGEAASRVSAGLRKQYPLPPWSEIAAFRNIAVHVYFNVNWSTVWNAAIKDVPVLRPQIAEVLRQLETGEQP